MASTKSNNSQKDGQPTPSIINPRRCSHCGELTKGHHLLPKDFCERVQQLKALLKSGESAPTGRPGTTARGEEGLGMSVSQANHRSALQMPLRLPTIVETEPQSHTTLGNEPAVIILPVSSRPQLKYQFAPILEMKTLLQLRSLQLSNFHTTEREDWAFVISGSQAMMKDYIAENRRLTTIRMNLQARRCRAIVALVLGVVVGIVLTLWCLPSGTM